MSKGIFIMPEVPPYCLRCPFEVCSQNRYFCDLHESITVSLKPMPLTDRQEKPDWCPIKPLPGKAHHEEYCDNGRYDKGWNDCLDEIDGCIK